MAIPRAHIDIPVPGKHTVLAPHNSFAKCMIDPKICSFDTPVEVHGYQFQNPQFENHPNVNRVKRASLAATPSTSTGSDNEADLNFRMNQTGNIYYATTTPEMNEATRNLFNSVTVLFAAMTKAVSDSGKSLFDYKTWTSMIGKSGFFVEMSKYRKTLSIKSSSITINTQVITALIPGLPTESRAMETCKDVLEALSGEYSYGSQDEKTEISHLLFICEELFGAPSVCVRLFYGSKESHSKITASPCHKTSSISFDQLQEANTFLFVDPDYIAQYAAKFENHPQEYENLVNKLKDYIKEDK